MLLEIAAGKCCSLERNFKWSTRRDATERMFRASVEEGEGEQEGREVGEKMHQSVQSEKRISLGNNNNNNKQNIWRRRRRRRSSIWPNGMCANCLMGQEATDALPSCPLPVPTPCPPSAPLPILLQRRRHYLIHEVQIGKNVSKENAAKETSAE